MALDHLVLGLVTSGVSHGYAIARRIEALLGEHDAAVQRSHVYAALAALERRELVTGRDEQPAGRRQRRSFTATDAGRRWLAVWLEREAGDGVSVLRRTLLVKILVRALLDELPSRRELGAERATRRGFPPGVAAVGPSHRGGVADDVVALLHTRLRRHRDVELWLLDQLDADRAAGPIDGPERALLRRARTGSASR
jgi:DNA-binding PadR family transcriptional regulator